MNTFEKLTKRCGHSLDIRKMADIEREIESEMSKESQKRDRKLH